MKHFAWLSVTRCSYWDTILTLSVPNRVHCLLRQNTVRQLQKNRRNQHSQECKTQQRPTSAVFLWLVTHDHAKFDAAVALSSAEKSVTVQTNKQTKYKYSTFIEQLTMNLGSDCAPALHPHYWLDRRLAAVLLVTALSRSQARACGTVCQPLWHHSHHCSSLRHYCLSGRICDYLLFYTARHDVVCGFVFLLCNVSL